MSLLNQTKGSQKSSCCVTFLSNKWNPILPAALNQTQSLCDGSLYQPLMRGCVIRARLSNMKFYL